MPIHVACCLIFLMLTSSAFSNTNPSILILNSYKYEYPWTKGQNKGFLQELQTSSLSADIYTEDMDTKRLNFDEKYKKFFANYLQTKYLNFQPSLIYTTDDNALSFILQYKEDLFPHSKVVFSGINNMSIANIINTNEILGVFEKKELKKNLELIQEFAPETKNIYFVGDNSNTYTVIKKELSRLMQTHPEYTAHFIESTHIVDVTSQLQALKPSIVILTTIGKFKNSAEQTIRLEDTLYHLTDNFEHIILSMEDAYMHKGIIGGYVTSSKEQGKEAAKIAIQYFQGKSFKQIPLKLQSPNRYYFDRQELKHNKIILPKHIEQDAYIINEDLSFLEKYIFHITVIIGILLVTTFLLLIFLVYLYRGKNLIIQSHWNKLMQAKEDAEDLNKEQQSLLSLFDKGDSVLFKWKNNETWSVEYVSCNVSNLLGHTQEAFTSSRVSYASCIHQDDIAQVSNEVQNALTQESDFFKHEPYRIITKNGETKWILDYTVKQRNTQNEITHFIGYLIDITTQKQIENELIDAKEKADIANKAKSEFLANMSHEIRTPLNGVIGLTELTLKTNLTSGQEDYLKKSLSSSKTLLYVINDILDYSKIESGQLNLESIQFSLNTVMSNINNLFEFQIKSKALSYNMTFPPSINIIGDSLRLTQILTNLIGNATKFTEKGSISIGVDIEEESDLSIKLKFSIIDTGIGINQEVQSKLFHKFMQADTSTTRNYGGTGLGLSISKNLIELMGGSITVKSEADKGSEFVFTLPFEKATSLDTSKEQDSDLNQISKKLELLQDIQILLVEDNKVNQLVLLGILEDYNIEIDIANNGKEGVEKALNNNYDLILMDLQMPVMDGFEATRIIRDSDTHIPIIALSAAVMKEDKEHSFQSGVNAHIEKPINKNELFSTLLDFLPLK